MQSTIGERMSTLEGRVAFITGAARGLGRCQAIHLAEQGADIIAVDLCRQIDTVGYPLATPEDLDETVRSVEALGRRIVASEADVRDADSLARALDAGVGKLGRADIVIANAGIVTWGAQDEWQAWQDTIDVNLSGAFNTVRVALPSMIEGKSGGSIVLVSSSAGLGTTRLGDGGGPGSGYVASKHGMVGLMRQLAKSVGKYSIRVNTVHPSGAATPMVQNDMMDRMRRESVAEGTYRRNLLPIGALEPIDVANAVGWLVSDAARYVTGVTLPIDAGFTVR
jgi:SDR family mycofactocin-dependent oxidoreductase